MNATAAVVGKSITYDGYRFNVKFKGKRLTSYWCIYNRCLNSECNAKLKVVEGTVISVIGEHHESCKLKMLGVLPEDNVGVIDRCVDVTHEMRK